MKMGIKKFMCVCFRNKMIFVLKFCISTAMGIFTQKHVKKFVLHFALNSKPHTPST